MRILKIITVLAVVGLPLAAYSQGSQLNRGLEEALKKTRPPAEDQKEGTCPDGMICAVLDAFTKKNYDSEVKRYETGLVTAKQSFDRVVIYQRIREEHGVIVNTIKVRKGGDWASYPQGVRLVAGRNEFEIPVPQGTPQIVISFDHGQGAKVKVVVERTIR